MLSVSSLLIVPYGIETRHGNACKCSVQLLIVPYGIETIVNLLGKRFNINLLIVPYGIETR